MAVVTIARQYGAGARLVGKMAAERLQYHLVDKELLHAVSQKASVLLETVGTVERISGDTLMRIFDELYSTSSRIRRLPGISAEFDEEKLRIFLTRTIREIAAQDRAVILGRGGQFILKDHPGAVHIYLVADEPDRIKHIMDQDGFDEEQAIRLVQKDEKKRLAFLCGFGDNNPEDASLYHLTINTSLVAHRLAADMICLLVEAQGKANG